MGKRGKKEALKKTDLRKTKPTVFSVLREGSEELLKEVEVCVGDACVVPGTARGAAATRPDRIAVTKPDGGGRVDDQNRSLRAPAVGVAEQSWNPGQVEVLSLGRLIRQLEWAQLDKIPKKRCCAWAALGK